MKRLKIGLLIGISALQGFTANGQDGVGIGTETVHSSAVFQVDAGNKGVLIPRLADPVATISSPADGLLVFNTTTQSFFFYAGGGWIELNTLKRPSSSGTASTIYGISAADYGLNATGNGPVPKGGIIMWSGTTPPTGWALCDGSFGRPDLRGRFVVGFDAGNGAYNQPGNISAGGATQGTMGGTATVQLTAAQSALPDHVHSISHGHVVNDPGHSHGILTGRNGGNGEITKMDADNPATKTTNTAKTGVTVAGHAGNSGSASKPLADEAHENRPPFYVLAYIIKL